MTTLNDLRANLTAASATLGGRGATARQINHILKLVGEAPELYFTARLSAAQASGLIDRLLNPIDFGSTETVVKPASKEDLASANAEYAEKEAKKVAWIEENYPDYADRSKKSRKRIRYTANQAIAA